MRRARAGAARELLLRLLRLLRLLLLVVVLLG